MSIFNFRNWFKKKEKDNPTFTSDILSEVKYLNGKIEEQDRELNEMIKNIESDDSYFETGKLIGTQIGDQIHGTRSIRKKFDAKIEFLDWKEQKRSDYLKKIGQTKQLIDLEIQKIEEEGEEGLSQIEKGEKAIEEISEEKEKAIQEMNGDQETEFLKRLDELEKNFIAHLEQHIINLPIESEKEITYISNFIKEERERLMAKYKEDIADPENQKNANLFEGVWAEIDRLPNFAENLVEKEKGVLNKKLEYHDRIKEKTKEIFQNTRMILKNQIAERIRKGVKVPSRLQIFLTLFFLCFILIGEFAIVFQTIKETFDLGVKELPTWAMSTFNFIFIFSYTIAFSLACKFFFSSFLKMFNQRWKWRKKTEESQLYEGEEQEGNTNNVMRNNSQFKEPDFEAVQLKRRFWVTTVVLLFGILSVVMIEPSNLLEIQSEKIESIKESQSSQNSQNSSSTTIDGLDGPAGETNNGSNNDLVGVIEGLEKFSIYGTLLFLIFITLLFAGVGGILYHDFIEMYEKFRNNGRGFFNADRYSSPLIKKIQAKLDVETKKLESLKIQLIRLKTARLQIEQRTLLTPEIEKNNLKRMLINYRDAAVHRFISGYEYGVNKIREEKDISELLDYKDKIKIHQDVLNDRKYQKWKDILEKFTFYNLDDYPKAESMKNINTPPFDNE